MRYAVLAILRCTKSHPNSLPPCPVSGVSYAPPTHSVVYRNRRTACEYPVPSCDVVSVEMCVRKRWFMMGVWWEWRVMSCFCRRCHKMFVSTQALPMDQSAAFVLRVLVEESSTLPPPPPRRLACICISLIWRGIHWQIGCSKESPQTVNETEKTIRVKWNEATEQISNKHWVASQQITVSLQERKRGRMLPQQPFSQLSAVQRRRWRIVFEKKTLSGLIV